MNDSEIIEGLKSSDDRVLEYLYKEYYHFIRKLVEFNSGNLADAEDVFQDGIIVLFEKVKEPGFKLSSTLKTYLYAICKNLWLKRLRTAGREVTLNDQYEMVADNDTALIEERLNSRQQIIKDALQKIGESCKNILILKFYKKFKDAEIAKELNYSGADYVKTQRYRCIKKLRELLKGKTNREDL